MEEQVFLTQKGYDELEKKLEHLKVVRRKEVAEEIKVAREFGDLSENAEYEAARNEQGRMESEISEIEQKLRKAIIINEDKNKSVVEMGSTVRIHDVDYDEDVEYTIVGTTEADPECNKISNEAPIGRALIGHATGETVAVTTPGGVVQIRILEIN